MCTAWDTEREKNRSRCYKLLAACFYEPDYEMFTGEDLFPNLAQALNSISPEAAGIAGKMSIEFSAEAQEAITIAHAKLFIGPFELSAPPYGSVYLEPGGRMMGETTIAVRNMYEHAGLVLRDELKDAPDHIAFELEFMHFLCEKTNGSIAEGDYTAAANTLKLQHEFFDNYLGKWVESFSSAVIQKSEHEFYSLLGRCLLMFTDYAGIPGALSELQTGN